MTDKELLIKRLELINRQQAEIDDLTERLNATIAGQETLQKALAEKNKEAAELNLDLKILREFDNCFKGNFGEIIEENKMLKNEVAELNSDLKLLKNDYDCLKRNFDKTIKKNKRLRDKVVGLTAEKDRLIETFGECQAEATKALAEKDKEIKRLKNNVFCSVVIDEEKMRNIINEKVTEFELDIELIKAEAIKECIEKTQAFLAIKCRGVVEDNPNLDEILWGYRKEDVDEFFDNLAKEMAGEG